MELQVRIGMGSDVATEGKEIITKKENNNNNGSKIISKGTM